MRGRNWILWGGLVLSIVAFVSYFTLFARYPVTRDVPWVNYILFAIAIVMLVAGVRRAQQRKWIAYTAAVVGTAIAVFFVLAVLVGSRMMPASPGAPHVGQKAPEFTLLDTNRRAVSLDSLLASSPRGVMLVFYRGYW